MCDLLGKFVIQTVQKIKACGWKTLRKDGKTEQQQRNSKLGYLSFVLLQFRASILLALYNITQNFLSRNQTSSKGHLLFFN